MILSSFVYQNERWNYEDMLLDADPSKSMIEKYINEGEMFIFSINENNSKKIVGETVCVKINEKEIEIKNLAVKQTEQNKGYGRLILEWIKEHYKGMKIIVGSSEKGKGFYQKCGFVFTHIIKNFFIDNYNEKIYEDGKQVIDMFMLKYE